MLLISEEVAERLVTLPAALAVVEKAFAAIADGDAKIFSVASAHGFDEAERWAVKSGLDRRSGALGFKVGSNWPGNRARGLATHGSTVVLMNPETGFAHALVAASYLTALRTAAADAVGVKHLARTEASILAVIGAGHQALWNVRAIALVRQLSDVRVAARTIDRGAAFVKALRASGVPARLTSVEEAADGADMITTATPAEQPVLVADWVSAGCHVSAMGADSPGKQELPLDLIDRASLFCDVPAQSVTIGEFQTAAKEGRLHAADITPIGSVISGSHSGRRNTSEITIFDSSGMAVQDLAICSLALELASASGLATEGA